MATATPHYAKPTPVIGVTLELSREEADVLVHVLRRVAGDPETSPRGTAQNVLHALYEALGAPDGGYNYNPLGRKASEGYITFRDTEA